MRFGLSKKTRVISYCLGQCRPASSILERKGSLEALFDCCRCHLQKTSWMGQNGATLFVMHIAYTCRTYVLQHRRRVWKNEGSSSGHSHLDTIFIYTKMCDVHHHFNWRIFGQMKHFCLPFPNWIPPATTISFNGGYSILWRLTRTQLKSGTTR